MTAAAPHLAAAFETRLQAFPEQCIAVGTDRKVGYRAAVSSEPMASASRPVPLVLLHGIGSGAASWLLQLESLGATRNVYAWDAPGYGVSTPVAAMSPVAADYAEVLGAWLDALNIGRCVLVGHSLGAIMAGAFAAAQPRRVAGLLLVSPASGYGAAAPEVRAEKRDNRLAMLAELGPAGLAEKRGGNMLSAHADDAARAWIRWNMARVLPHGYAQATHLLANADLAADLGRFDGLVGVAVGADDKITPPAACQKIADAAHVALQSMPHAGHAGYVEAPAAYTALIDAFCRSADAQGSTP